MARGTIGKALKRVEGLVWGDQVRDASVYFDDLGLVIDAFGRDAGAHALLVRGLDSRNQPTELLRLNKDGALSLASFVSPTLTTPAIADPAITFTNSHASTALAANTDLAAASYTDLMSLTLQAGTWLLLTQLTAQTADPATEHYGQFRLYDGTSTLVACEVHFPVGPTFPTTAQAPVLFTLVTPASATTYKVQGRCSSNLLVNVRATTADGLFGPCSTFRAVRLT